MDRLLEVLTGEEGGGSDEDWSHCSVPVFSGQDRGHSHGLSTTRLLPQELSGPHQLRGQHEGGKFHKTPPLDEDYRMAAEERRNRSFFPGRRS